MDPCEQFTNNQVRKEGLFRFFEVESKCTECTDPSLRWWGKVIMQLSADVESLRFSLSFISSISVVVTSSTCITSKQNTRLSSVFHLRLLFHADGFGSTKNLHNGSSVITSLLLKEIRAFSKSLLDTRITCSLSFSLPWFCFSPSLITHHTLLSPSLSLSLLCSVIHIIIISFWFPIYCREREFWSDLIYSPWCTFSLLSSIHGLIKNEWEYCV